MISITDQKIKIMVVEDNPINMKLVSDLLEIEGFEVSQCKDAETALDTVYQILPDLILMDVALPGMDGLQLTKILKADDKTKEIIIIALTAFAMKGDMEKVFEAGCNGYISKPIDTRKFKEQIIQLLDQGEV